MKEKILFEAYTGSKLYGTNSATSDTDIKGIFLPNLNDLILDKAPKHYVESTSSKYEHNTKDDIDKTYYSLQYFLELAAKGETNAIDLLFAYTNKDAVITMTPEWEYLIANIDKVVTKQVNSFVGYCKTQSIKYSIKGEKLEAYIALRDFVKNLIDKDIKNEDGAWLDLGTALMEFKEYKIGIYSDYEKKGKVIGKRAPIAENVFNKPLFGNHDYIVIMNNKEQYLMVSDMLFGLRDTIVTCLHKVQNVIDSYGKRAEIALENNGADYKAISHCVRVLYQVESLLTTGRIEFPLKQAEKIKAIKYNTTKLTRDEIMEMIDSKIKNIDEVLLPTSKLREKADRKFLDKFILNAYKIGEK